MATPSATATSPNAPSRNTSERVIIFLLRLIGAFGLFAVPAIFLPYTWMDEIHAWMGLGKLPDAPIVSYLSRTLSMFYATSSVMMLAISLDVRRYRPLIRVWGTILLLSGCTFLGIDLYSGMPADWTWSEGPPTIVVALLVLWLQRRIPE